MTTTEQVEKSEDIEYGWPELECDLGVEITLSPEVDVPQVTYQCIERSDTQQRIDAAFDILFDEVKKILKGDKLILTARYI